MRPDYPPFTPTLVHSQSDLAATLAARRDQMRLTVEQVDDIAGLQPRYTGKLEHPEKAWGRGCLTLQPVTATAPAGSINLTFLGETWLDAMGLKLLLVSHDQAKAIGAVPAPPRPTAQERRALACGFNRKQTAARR